MPSESYPPQKLATVELLTQEIAFSNPSKIVNEINNFYTKNTKYDSEYYQITGTEPGGDEKTIKKVKSIMLSHLQQMRQTSSKMEYHALVQSLPKKDKIPRIEDAILLRSHLLFALDIARDTIKFKHLTTDPDKEIYLEHFIQRWIYKFCRHIFDFENIDDALIALFEQEQKKGKTGFNDLIGTFTHMSDLHLAPDPGKVGYDPLNMRRLYVVFSHLLFAYLLKGIPVPRNLQKIFVEFQKNKFFDYEQFKNETESTQAEWKCLLIQPGDASTFFKKFKQIDKRVKKAVLLGMLVDAERKFAIEQYCNMSLRGVAELYLMTGKNLSSGKMTAAQGKDWFINVYRSITEVVAEKKIVENTSIPEALRKVFGDPQSFEAPQFNDAEEEEEREVKNKNSAIQQKPSESAAPAPVPVDIPNLVAAKNLEELKDSGATKKIVIVQDSNVLDLVVKNWEIRGNLTFPELIEFARIPFQVLQPKSPGIREGRKFVSFAYLIALGLDEEHIRHFVEKLAKTKQISAKRASQLQRLYPIAMEQIGELQQLNTDARPLVSPQGFIIPGIFIEKCEALQKIFMGSFSYIQSLLSYWIIVEEIYFSIAKATAVMGNISNPTPQQIEKFTQSRNAEFMASYEKALTFAGALKTYFKKKYKPELQKQFVNVKIKNDLLQFANTEPVNLAERQ
ncbi:MAG: hypothetical protein HQM13_08845 [SAR324 cluster bacterium]|nr:hypothetical protein [SAR324 cluster bacterium]